MVTRCIEILYSLALFPAKIIFETRSSYVGVRQVPSVNNHCSFASENSGNVTMFFRFIWPKRDSHLSISERLDNN